MRVVVRQLALLLLLLALVAGCGPSRDEDIARYVAARGRNVQLTAPLWAKRAVDSAIAVNDAFVREFSPLLKRIVGPLEMPGLADSANMHIGTQACTTTLPSPTDCAIARPIASTSS